MRFSYNKKNRKSIKRNGLFHKKYDKVIFMKGGKRRSIKNRKKQNRTKNKRSRKRLKTRNMSRRRYAND